MTKVVVYHRSYGCDTGCCGHVVRLGAEQEEFDFTHPHKTDDHRAWAESLVQATFGSEHVADLDWDNCIIVND